MSGICSMHRYYKYNCKTLVGNLKGRLPLRQIGTNTMTGLLKLFLKKLINITQLHVLYLNADMATVTTFEVAETLAPFSAGFGNYDW